MQMYVRFLRGSGPSLFVRYVQAENARATMIFAHGSMVHSEYYIPFALNLAGHGISSVLFDFTGHGRSDGIRGHLSDFRRHVEDMLRVVDSTSPAGSILLLGGESYGALVVWAAFPQIPDTRRPQELLLVSPAFRLRVALTAWQQRGLRNLARVWPRFRSPWPMGLAGVSKHPDIEDLVERDPLLCRRYTVGFFVNLLTTEAQVGTMPIPDVPVMSVLASNDFVVDTEAVRTIVSRLPAPSTIRVIPNSLHGLCSDHGSEIAREFSRWCVELGDSSGLKVHPQFGR
ncbi:MAG: alpha/beta fold hydrolase [Thermaerobacter sp.]|nr:alpha/beta fold hydrolase [Thermaerobacter sp.]